MASLAVGSNGEVRRPQTQNGSEVSAAAGVKSNGQVVDGNGKPVTTGVSTTPVSSNDVYRN